MKQAKNLGPGATVTELNFVASPLRLGGTLSFSQTITVSLYVA